MKVFHHTLSLTSKMPVFVETANHPEHLLSFSAPAVLFLISLYFSLANSSSCLRVRLTILPSEDCILFPAVRTGEPVAMEPAAYIELAFRNVLKVS